MRDIYKWACEYFSKQTPEFWLVWIVGTMIISVVLSVAGVLLGIEWAVYAFAVWACTAVSILVILLLAALRGSVHEMFTSYKEWKADREQRVVDILRGDQ